ncbi:MAG: iron chelate uptake ABC transporter family permease subunit, partial [Ilumatobacteraceae bacterium]
VSDAIKGEQGFGYDPVFLIGADIPGRLLTSPSETPIGVVTAFFGAPFFLFLLRTREVRQ